MAEFEVEITQIETYLLTVNADDESNAEIEAWNKMAADGKGTYHHDSDAKVDVVRL